MFTRNVTLGDEELVHVHENGGDDTEEETESEHHNVSDAHVQRRRSSEKGFLARILRERRRLNLRHGQSLVLSLKRAEAIFQRKRKI